MPNKDRFSHHETMIRGALSEAFGEPIHIGPRDYLEKTLAGLFHRMPDMSGDQRKRLVPCELASVQEAAEKVLLSLVIAHEIAAHRVSETFGQLLYVARLVTEAGEVLGPNNAIVKLAERAVAEATQDWTCLALASPNGPSDSPDCNWPVCGCDPYADKVLAALQEAGMLCPPAPQCREKRNG